MSVETRVSVVMAAYNGQDYIKKQIQSIVNQLTENDELIISDNYSTDSTWKIIKEFEAQDKRIRCVQCEHKGILFNFEYALSYCRGKYVFLSDQDDIWLDNKVLDVMNAFETYDPVLVIHNCQFIDKDEHQIEGDLFRRRNARVGLLKNLMVNSYQGSCMAFHRDLLERIIPFPSGIAMHDQWIGLIAERVGRVVFLDECLLLYRRHDNAASDVSIPIYEKIGKMIYTYRELIKRLKLE